MLKALIFDADKTLYRSRKKEEAYKKVYSFLSKKTGIDESRIKNVHRHIIETIKNSPEPAVRRYNYSLKQALQITGRKNVETLATQAETLFWKTILGGLHANPGAFEAIKQLKKDYRLVIASDEFFNNLNKKLKKVFGQWDKYFELVITPEDTGVMKPSKRYYTLALQHLGISNKELAVIGDSWHKDLQPASQLGIKTVLIAEKKEGRPDLWLKSIKDIADKIKKIK